MSIRCRRTGQIVLTEEQGLRLVQRLKLLLIRLIVELAYGMQFEFVRTPVKILAPLRLVGLNALEPALQGAPPGNANWPLVEPSEASPRKYRPSSGWS